MKKVAKIITSAVVAAAVAVTGISLGVHFGYADKKVVQKEHNIKPNNDALRTAKARTLISMSLLKKRSL